MLRRVIDFSLDQRWLVLVFTVLVAALGIYTMLRLPIDAFPDLTNNQIVVITECPAMPPTEVEQLVTYPIETTLMGLPRATDIRSISKLGLSMVTVVFQDSVNTYFARQLVNERLQEVRSRLPQGLEPRLGPVATAFGEVYQYTLEGSSVSVMDRKTLHDWQIRNQLRTVPGVNEINTWGGETKTFAVVVDPASLQRYGLTLHDVAQRVQENNANFGGGFLEHADEQYTVRGLGRTTSGEDIGRIVLRAKNGTPVYLRDVAQVQPQALPRQGAVLRDGHGETVSGMVIMLKGENGRDVIQRVKAKIAQLRLPDGVKLVPFYDQSEVIDGTIHTVVKNLIEAGVLVVLVLLLFLGNLRAALIVASIIPLSMLFGFFGMAAFGISANLMSLGAIDFGMIVDGAVVMMENSVRHLHGEPRAGRLEVIRQAAREVARPILFAVLIIIAVYLPIFTLEGLEGRMFRPMAITVCSALLGSLLLALLYIPALASIGLGRHVAEKEDRWFQRLHRGYERSLRWSMAHRPVLIGVSMLALAAALGSLALIGTEFMPRLDEGSLLITTRKLPGISLSESITLSNRVEQILRGFPEVRSVITKMGRPDLATEAMGVYEADVYVLLKPVNEWSGAQSKERLIEQMSQRLEKIPGVAYNFTQPMAMRLDEVVSGIKADVAVKIFGEDPRVLEQLAARALSVLSAVPGATDSQAEIISGVAELHVEVDREALARYGLNVSDVQELVEASIGGRQVSEMVQDQRRFPILIRLPEEVRRDAASLGALPLQAPGGERVRLDQVSRLTVQRGPEVVSREGAQRRIVVQANVRGRDLGSFVAEAQRRMAQSLALPAGYAIEWGGQFENQERAMRRLQLVVPASLVLIFGLLYLSFHSFRRTLLILAIVPFASIGGVAALWLVGLNLNLSAAIGFIALFGVAVLNGVVMVSTIHQLQQERATLQEAVLDGAGTRLRPVLMTALVASLGFVPMAVSRSTGAEVQRPLATVVIGGLVSATLLTLYLLPVLYSLFGESKRVRREAPTPVEARG